MFCLYGTMLIILLCILLLLRIEERRVRKSITHGLANKFWILRERRRFVRFDKEIKIRYNLKDKSLDSQNSKTTNISKSGLCMVTYEKLEEKKYLDLELEVPDFPAPIKVTGEVAWTKDLKTTDADGKRLFYVGIRFYKITPDTEAILLSYLNTLKWSPHS